MTTAAVETTTPVRACLFVLHGARFGIDVQSVREVVVVDEFTPVPRAPAYLVGVANLRGLVLPILDIRPLLGLPAEPVGRGTRLLVVETGAGQVGLVVEAVVGLTSFPEVQPFGEAARRAYGESGLGLATHQSAAVTLLDAAKLVQALKRPGGE
jgi:chemotaxis signal transduction protein